MSHLICTLIGVGFGLFGGVIIASVSMGASRKPDRMKLLLEGNRDPHSFTISRQMAPPRRSDVNPSSN